MDDLEIGTTIKQHRTELGWSQEALAEKAYVSRQTVSNWETEKSYPDVHSLLILSDLFGVSLDELIKGDVAVMKEQVKSKDVRTFKKLQLICGLGILLLIVTGVPLLEYGGAIGDNRHKIVAAGQFIRFFGVLLDLQTWLGNAGRVCQGKVTAVVDLTTRDHLDLPLPFIVLL